ncbi:MAG: DUF4180 domain-containing protein [Patescibacteria group bacterium]|nr:DUF4180 domain-containing protein [Patescibacteria group bacterium]
MNITFYEEGQRKAVEIASDQVLIKTVQDALDTMANPKLMNVRNMILHKENIDPAFFDLKTGLAGEILQKFVNYGIRLAIVGDFTNIASESLRAFILECNRGNQIFFVEDVDAARKKLFIL